MTEFWPTLNSVCNGDVEEQKAAYLLSHSNCNLLRNPKFLKTNHTHNKFKHTAWSSGNYPPLKTPNRLKKTSSREFKHRLGADRVTWGFGTPQKLNQRDDFDRDAELRMDGHRSKLPHTNSNACWRWMMRTDLGFGTEEIQGLGRN